MLKIISNFQVRIDDVTSGVENVKKLLEDLSDDELESQLTVLKVTQHFFVYIL
jgi:hypothetical protein